MIYLDNGASSHPKPEAVYRAVEKGLRIGANPGRGGHRPALDASRVIFETREKLAELIKAPDSSRIVFTLNATHALNQAVKGLLEPGDHVVTSSMEHNALLRPLHTMESRGAQLTIVDGDEQGRVDPAKIEAAMDTRTKLVALAHASNLTGAIQEIGRVGELCKEAGALLLVDGSQTVGSLTVDVTELGVSMLAAPGHKGLLGPQGTGFLWVGEGVELSPLMEGGTGSMSESRLMPAALPEALEAGTMNTPGLAGLGAGIDYLLDLTVEEVRAHEVGLTRLALELLAGIDKVSVYGPSEAEKRTPVIPFNVEGLDGSDVGRVLEEDYDIAVRVGLHCAPDGHRTIGTFPGGAVRASFGPFNTTEDVEQLVRGLRELAEA